MSLSLMFHSHGCHHVVGNEKLALVFRENAFKTCDLKVAQLYLSCWDCLVFFRTTMTTSQKSLPSWWPSWTVCLKESYPGWENFLTYRNVSQRDLQMFMTHMSNIIFCLPHMFSLFYKLCFYCFCLIKLQLLRRKWIDMLTF